MTITLRAHHLLCVLTYSGKGYSPAFVTNFDSVVRRLQAGEALEILNSSKITALIVTDAGKPVGIVHLHDLLRAGVA